MPYCEGVTGQVFYREWPVSDPVACLVFLHGVGEHSGLYQRLAEALNVGRIAVFALDEIGHGLTVGERGVIGSMDDLVSNAEVLSDISISRYAGVPLVIAGHSLGAVVATLCVVRSPRRYRAVVLSAASLSPPTNWGGRAGRGEWEEGLNFTLSDLSLDPTYVKQLTTDELAFTASDEMAASLRRILPSAWEEISVGLPRLTLPVLVVHGEDDPISPVSSARGWANRLVGGRLKSFPGARHDVLNDVVYEEVGRVIAEFVIEVAAAGRGPGG
jgi:alpha-beta hydrolase superfamily lysophospholipase